MPTNPTVAVAILSWNGRKFLEQFLPSVVATTYAHATHYVIDNASTDDTAVWLAEHYPQVKLVALPTNLGFAGGYNEGLKQIQADYYVLLNQDVEVTPGWLEPMVELMEQHPEAGACQPKLRAYHQKDYFEYAGAAGGFMDYLGYTFCRGRLFDVVEKDEGQYDTVIPIFWASGAAMFVRAKLYHQLGGLDADFFAHMEEIDLCWRMKNAGYSLLYTPHSLVYHVGGGSLPQGNPRKTFLNFRNNLWMMYKNLPEASFKRTLALRLMLDVIAAYRSLLTGKVGDYKAIAKAHMEFFNTLSIIRKKRVATQALSAGKTANTEGLYNKSILWQFFAKGKQKFSELGFGPQSTVDGPR